MKEGYWINYRTGKVFKIHEHEQWIRDAANARKLGLSRQVIDGFCDFKPAVDRSRFLLFLMTKCPIMRVRGHGDDVTFEFRARSMARPMAAIRQWAGRNAGPMTLLNIVNLANMKRVHVLYKDLPPVPKGRARKTRPAATKTGKTHYPS
jgi:hypothetical protein